MKSLFILISTALLIVAYTPLHCNGIALNSIGPRGLGMAGALIGLADDYTAIWYNPAGLINLTRTQFGIYYSATLPNGTYYYKKENVNIPINTKTETSIFHVPGLMGSVPIMSGDLVASIGIFVPSGLSNEWNGKDLSTIISGNNLNWSNKINNLNVSAALAYKIIENVFVAVAFNLYYAAINTKYPYKSGQNQYHQYSESGSGLGYGLFGGLLLKTNELFNIGISFKTKATAKMNGNAENPALPILDSNYSSKSEFERDLSFPLWLGFGVSSKAIDKLTLCFDLNWSNWANSHKEIITTYKNWKNTNNDTMTLNWMDVLQIRFGAEYELNKKIILRGGVYSAPSPVPNETYTLLYPVSSYTGITLGTTFIFEQLGIDLGLEYLAGKEREVNVSEDKIPTVIPGKHNMSIITFSIGFNYKFGE